MAANARKIRAFVADLAAAPSHIERKARRRQRRERESIAGHLPVLARPPYEGDAVASWFHRRLHVTRSEIGDRHLRRGIFVYGVYVHVHQDIAGRLPWVIEASRVLVGVSQSEFRDQNGVVP